MGTSSNTINSRPVQGNTIRRLFASIGLKIIVPFLLLTLAVASGGAFIITNLITNSLQERFNNQLVDAGRVVSQSMTRSENERLRVLRAVANTTGVSDSLANQDTETLSGLVPQIVLNSNTDIVELLNMDGIEVYGWQRRFDNPQEGDERTGGTDFSDIEDVRLVLQGFEDEEGDKRIFLSKTAEGQHIIFTVGPIFQGDEQIGAVMVGTYVRRLIVELTLNAIARVTLYDRNGEVIDTTLARGDPEDPLSVLDATTEVPEVQDILRESPEQYEIVRARAADVVPLRQVEIQGQRYVLAFGDWRLRDQSFGMFSVALPSNFIFSTVVNNRNAFSYLFVFATVAVFVIGFFIAQRITRPLNQLVETAVAVSQGDLARRSGIRGYDEIGQLAYTFDMMTERLAQRNLELMKQTSELQAILQSIADGVIVLDTNDQIITSNTAARQLLADMSFDFMSGPMRELTAGLHPNNEENGRHSALPDANPATPTDETNPTDEITPAIYRQPHRYQVGNRVLSALAAPVTTPEGEKVGTVIVLRDITQEAEAEQLKDAFITTISHELRTPLTVIKVYTDLLLKTGNGKLEEKQIRFLQNINKGSEQLERHINQLINISEIQAGTINLQKERLDFVKLLQELTSNWEERIREKGLQFETIMPDQPIWIMADEVQLGWAIENLLSNAYNYTLEGKVTVCAGIENGEACLEVTDTGIGIAAADQEHLFERFFRASNALNYDVRGVGLGLFITKSVVEMHNGRIWVKSELGQGSTFGITLPLADS
ncbi:MAG: HAMP domain-containing protein [Chloroflexi bacterium]|nr:MAG: HAMP domain-containing protein [Chloroflexota bacterium]